MSRLPIADVIKSIRDLPPLPALVVELMSNLDREEAGSRMLAEKISHDQALMAKTLRLANSSFYGVQGKVSTIQQAIAIVGFNSIRTLVTAAALIGKFSGEGRDDFNFKAFWRHSIATALCAKALARHLKVNQDHAFMVGLLHDIGRLVLVSHAPKIYQQVVAHRAAADCSMIEAERAVLEIDHAVVGRALAEHWKFPVLMQKAIERHHAPEGQEANSLIQIVHVADAVVHALDLSGEEDELVPPVSAAAWDSLDVARELFLQVFRETELQTEEACQILMT